MVIECCHPSVPVLNEIPQIGMNTSATHRRPGAFSPHPLSSPALHGYSQSTDPSESDSSSSSPVAALAVNKRSPHPQQQPQTGRRPPIPSGSSNASSTSVNNFTRPSIVHTSSEQPVRRNSPFLSDLQKHKRQHSQGFFEPSLPTANLAEQATMTNLTASQIAAQAAMQHQASSQQAKYRSQMAPGQQSSQEPAVGRRKPPLLLNTDTTKKVGGVEPAKQEQYQNGLIGGHSAAATAANAAFPRNVQLSPGLTTFQSPVEKQHTLKNERSKIKLFSKPKQHGTINTKDMVHSSEVPLNSPKLAGSSGAKGLSKMVNPSMTSLTDSIASGPSSFYKANNNSTSALLPLDRQVAPDKEKPHKHHFLSRQKNKFKDRIGDDHATSVPSASSNSKPLDQNAAQALYSLPPPSPGPSMTSFSKSVSGLDLRHGGRALRERKKEEKAFTAHQASDPKRADAERNDWNLSSSFSSLATPSLLSQVPTSSTPTFGGLSYFNAGDALASQVGLQGLGLSNMSPEDAWDVLKVKLFVVFEGEDLRIPVEDSNRLVTIHIQHCIHKQVPTAITQDIRDLLQTGFKSLNNTLEGIPDHRLVPALVDVWLFVFGTVLPQMQAVFLPLDIEYKEHSRQMTARTAAEFWGVNPRSTDDAFGKEFDVRHIVLLSFRDHVILPHHDSLKATFSRLSLESINASVTLVSTSPDLRASARPDTAGSLDPGMASFNSQGSTLLGDGSGSRSRAASNLSAPELPPFTPSRFPPAPAAAGPPASAPAANSSQITETVARMLQCVSVLGSLQSGDEAQAKMEGLAKELKLNWLGRGRTGRNRRGFVGARVPPPPPPAVRRHASSLSQSQSQSQSQGDGDGSS